MTLSLVVSCLALFLAAFALGVALERFRLARAADRVSARLERTYGLSAPIRDVGLMDWPTRVGVMVLILALILFGLAILVTNP